MSGIDISTTEFPEKVLARSGEVPVVVDFWAAWCGPCRILGPLLERAADEADGEWDLVKVDVDQNQQLAAEFGVQGIPTVIGFRDGRPAARFTGALPEAQVRQWLRELVPSGADRLTAAATEAVAAGAATQAEALYREALEIDPSHVGAGTGLARLLLDGGEAAAAVEALAPLPDVEAVRVLRTRADLAASALDVGDLEAALAADPGDLRARLDLGRALAAGGEFGAAFDHLLQVVESHTELSDPARVAMLDLFGLTADPALVADYRRRLANALF